MTNKDIKLAIEKEWERMQRIYFGTLNKADYCLIMSDDVIKTISDMYEFRKFLCTFLDFRVFRAKNNGYCRLCRKDQIDENQVIQHF